MTNQTMDIGTSVTATANVNALNLLDPLLTTALEGIRVFDVGQGDCLGLLDQSLDVFCYVDYGGLNDHPDGKNPAATPARLPVQIGSRLVSIILTHWDKDHYYSAVKKNTAAQACEWLVPRQHASPQAVRFAAKLSNAKCWPESHGNNTVRVGVGQTHDIEIRKCAAFDPTAIKEDRNHTGLAIALLRWKGVTVDGQMILPGDCHFDGIPNLPSASIEVLVAYHHGSPTDWTVATGPAIANFATPRALAYSFGKNTYGHPYRANYIPDWDPHSISTQDIRGKGKQFDDLRW